MLNIAVLVKQVPRTDKIKIDHEKGTLIRKGVESILNPYCEYALDMAISLKKTHKTEITAITMGPSQSEMVLRRSLALGADKAVLMNDRAFAGADCWATAYTLKKGLDAVFKDGCDIIFCGVQAIDGDTAQVPAEVSQMMGIPLIPYANSVEVDAAGKTVTAQCEIDDSLVTLTAEMPVLVTVRHGSNNRRMPSVPNVRKAFGASVELLDAKVTGCDADKTGLSGSPTRVVKIEPAVKEGACEFYNGQNLEHGIDKILEKWHQKEVK